MKDPIKIRISYKSGVHCTACGKLSDKERKEFYDMMIGDKIIHLCYDCLDVMFRKTLKAQVNYQGKTKTLNSNIRR